PMTFVALDNDQPVGMASLRENDGIQPDRTPWLGSLVVDPAYRKQKIGEKLIDVVKQRAALLGYPKLYLLAFDETISTWYTSLGWKSIGTDELFGHSVAVMDINLQ
ncbi:MAG TPA: GNAT family N-acetyltransferase, partial [Gammaproteobacteria bacterium]|nr:GNAT family N-acetyltransferase [Gammaproteobacteria bacterium]